ncbi:hypothetical protein PFISCL1PPCAC_7281, partial [Pristionchus fissidentatus]
LQLLLLLQLRPPALPLLPFCLLPLRSLGCHLHKSRTCRRPSRRPPLSVNLARLLADRHARLPRTKSRTSSFDSWHSSWAAVV